MNIGIFTDTYLPQINGVVTSIQTLEKELTNLGHNVYIFTTSDPSIKTKERNIFRLKSLPFVFLPTARVALWYPPKLLLAFKKFKLDIIHTQTEFALGIFGRSVAEFYKIPTVHTYHTMYEDYVHYVAKGRIITPKIARQFSRIFCNGAEAVISPTIKTRDALLTYNVVKPIEIIPTGLDFKPFKKENFTKDEITDLKIELGIDINSPIILFIGRIGYEKSIDLLIKGMPKILETLPKAKLVIVGDGPYLKNLRILCQELFVVDSVIFTGAKPWSEISKYYQLGDVYATASTSETQGLTYIEALASSLPLVAHTDDCISDLVQHGVSGFLFNNIDEYVSCILKVLTGKVDIAELNKKGLEAIDYLSCEKFGESIVNLYERLVNSPLDRKRLKLFKLKVKKNKDK